MDEITFEDVLTHYKSKIQEYTEQLTNIKLDLKKIDSMAESSWNGDAANAFKNKLNEQITDINKVLAGFSEATAKLLLIQEDYNTTLDV